ncbi:MAG: bifunctional UDP-3-O-[3-hydroxymyristoyl] N-acetylglucosamine deacetylase/3-hydroxyacyl-ACP dehydratase [Candidatus Omnitrophica bacterium]|nr:bifunctional UDP-3-O-[3-hydroxymyristoyl] N-acetylglucosamine deacetylase/3-hydroxyacyl-ACP dehydratase [Candidatus Omnitrophota bacterium]
MRLKGTGIHTGAAVELQFQPAPEGTGIVFVRTDLSGRPRIPAMVACIQDTAPLHRRTTIGQDQVSVQTIEHLMAALWGLGIDNLVIELNGPEVPGMDGSAVAFVDTLQRAGLAAQSAPRRVLDIREPVYVEHNGAAITALPYDGFRISYTLSYDHPLLHSQFVTFNATNRFAEEIAPARTFCMEQEAEALRRQGLGRGATYENTLVWGPKGVIQNRLRFEDECARHKVLDLLGDLYLLGAPLRGHILAVKSGHGLNMGFVRALAKRFALPSTTPAGSTTPVMDVEAIQKILPHRYPFLLVDRLIELGGQRAVGIKNVTVNEAFFQGHFPNRPVMPGVLLVEAMAQVAGIIALRAPDQQGRYAYLMGVDKAKFRRPVVPGDQLVITAEVLRCRASFGQVRGTVTVEDKMVAEAEITFAFVDG